MPPRRKRYRKPGSGGDGSFFKRMQRLSSQHHQPSLDVLDATLKEIFFDSRPKPRPVSSRSVLARPCEDLLAPLPLETIAVIASFLPLVPDVLNLQCLCQRTRGLLPRVVHAMTSVVLPGDVRSCLHFQRIIASIAPFVERLSCTSEGVTNPLIWSAVSAGLPPMPRLVHLQLSELPDRVVATRLSFPPLLRTFKYDGTDPVNWSFLADLVGRVRTLDSLEIRGFAHGAPGDKNWLKGRSWRALRMDVVLQDSRAPTLTFPMSERRRRAIDDFTASLIVAVEGSAETLQRFSFAEPCNTALLDSLQRCENLERLSVQVDRRRATKIIPLLGGGTLRSIRLAFPVLCHMSLRQRSEADGRVEEALANLATYHTLREVVIDGCGTLLELSGTSMRALSGIVITSLELLTVDVTVGDLAELGGALTSLRDFTIQAPRLGRDPETYRFIRKSCPNLRKLEVPVEGLADPAVCEEIARLRSNGVKVY
ncbi:hypothetical protein Pmar_PMAR029013 [Perkinsus marinus ATCC 50983]|uniref:Uncharacterized protein n=1 Tax=Perkinsus marinus (strain ATCC 50983 / TXsc) TaxID=423536 RepID=C5L697_PERM5|nr:hypothetical protein Pmar_PMAR029013 [Perkinsus marinus ATCC 50983]EER07724.1 hypothetical protein Pmar_PMAR029013 [Perkinsus marinus ATCC 50983]|eukprot:XP_002775908.1 hypothetical protein Pmar_PMAR029013 [Perkinsus marinus ATCC 50983]